MPGKAKHINAKPRVVKVPKTKVMVVKSTRSGPPTAVANTTRFKKTSGMEDRFVEGQLYLGPITTSASPAAGDILMEKYLTPTMVMPSPLGALAAIFSKFEFLWAKFEYTTVVGSQTAGGLFGWFDTNPESAAPNATAMGAVSVAHKGAAQWQVWNKAEVNFTKSHAPDKQFYCRPDGDIQNWAQAILRVGSPVALAASTTYGHAYLRFRARFFDPQLDTNLSIADSYDLHSNGVITGNWAPNARLLAYAGGSGGVFDYTQLVGGLEGKMKVLPNPGALGGMGLPIQAGAWAMDINKSAQWTTATDTTSSPVLGFYNSDGINVSSQVKLVQQDDIIAPFLGAAGADGWATTASRYMFEALEDIFVVPFTGSTGATAAAPSTLAIDLVAFAAESLVNLFLTAEANPQHFEKIGPSAYRTTRAKMHACEQKLGKPLFKRSGSKAPEPPCRQRQLVEASRRAADAARADVPVGSFGSSSRSPAYAPLDGQACSGKGSEFVRPLQACMECSEEATTRGGAVVLEPGDAPSDESRPVPRDHYWGDTASNPRDCTKNSCMICQRKAGTTALTVEDIQGKVVWFRHQC